MGGPGARTWDKLETLGEWFYATEYISSVSLAFQDLRRQSINQSINQKRIRVTKVTNITARPLLQY